MNDTILKAWDERNHLIKKWLRNNRNHKGLDYEDLLRDSLQLMFEEYDAFNYRYPDWNKIECVDFGDYQGTKIFLIPCKTYQPQIHETYWTYVDYGSCSGCDTLQAIQFDFSVDTQTPSEQQVTDYWTLILHMMQRMRLFLSPENALHD